jgi:uncharacterized DUF497 family protein
MGDEIRFEWDELKAASNLAKHGVAFDEAVTVFYDEHALVFDDPDHSDDEDRFLILGLGRSLRVLLVSHCWRDSDSVIRIISARRATSREASRYGR